MAYPRTVTPSRQLSSALLVGGAAAVAAVALWLVLSSGPADVTGEYQRWSAANAQAPGARYAAFVTDISANERLSSYTFTTRLGIGDGRAVDLCESYRAWAEAREQRRKGSPELRLAVLNEAGETAAHADLGEACQPR